MRGNGAALGAVFYSGQACLGRGLPFLREQSGCSSVYRVTPNHVWHDWVLVQVWQMLKPIDDRQWHVVRLD